MTRLRLHKIHLAVLKKKPSQVRRLLRHKKSNVDLQDSRGATPLMLAAVVASPKLVTLLLEKGADYKRRDNLGYSAADYAQGSHVDVYKPLINRSSASTRHRHNIYHHLRDPGALSTQYGTKAPGTLAFHRHGKSLRIFKLIAKAKLPSRILQNRTRTAACIAPGKTVRPEMCAVSGWTAISSSGVLDGQKFTQIVRDMAEILGFDLPRHCYDTPGGGSLLEDVGRFNAAHCEKLLAAYWVTEQLTFAFGSPDLSRMSRLKRFGLPLQRRRATVFIDRPPCIPCRLFLAAIQEATGIQICVFPQAIVETPARKNRSGLGVCMNCSCTNCKRAGKTSASRCANDYGESIPAPVSTPLGWSRLEGRDGANVCHKPIHTPVFTNPFQDKTDEPDLAGAHITLRAPRASHASTALSSSAQGMERHRTGASAHLEVILRSIPPTLAQEYTKVTPVPSTVSFATNESIGTGPQHGDRAGPSTTPSQVPKARKNRLKQVVDRLQLRERFEYRPQAHTNFSPAATITKAARRKQKKPFVTKKPIVRASLGPVRKDRRDARMASRSTLLANAKFRREILERRVTP